MLSLFRTVQSGTNALIFRIVPTAAYMLLRLAYAVSFRAEERIRKGRTPKTDRLDKWAKRIAAQLDRTLPEGRCRPGTALFCGSSTFTYWHNLKNDLRSEQDLPMQNVVKTILQMLSSRSSTLIVGHIDKSSRVHKLESIDRYELSDLIAEHKERLDNCMNTIISNLHILHDMQGCNEVTFIDNKLVLSHSDRCIVPPDEIFEKLKA